LNFIETSLFIFLFRLSCSWMSSNFRSPSFTVIFFPFNLWLSVRLDSLSCSFTIYLQMLLEHVYLFTTTRGLMFIVLSSSFSLAKVIYHIGWQFVYMFRSFLNFIETSLFIFLFRLSCSWMSSNFRSPSFTSSIFLKRFSVSTKSGFLDSLEIGILHDCWFCMLSNFFSI
jgi:hypothetical protein